jgi:hypothetical protein
MSDDTNPQTSTVHMPNKELQLAVCAHLIQTATDNKVQWTLSDKKACVVVRLHTSLMQTPDDTSALQTLFLEAIRTLLDAHYPAYTWLTTPSANKQRQMLLLDEYNLPILAITVILDDKTLSFDIRRWQRVMQVSDLDAVKPVDIAYPGTALLSELGEGISFRYCNDSTEEVYTLVEHASIGERVVVKTLNGRVGLATSAARVIPVGTLQKN